MGKESSVNVENLEEEMELKGSVCRKSNVDVGGLKNDGPEASLAGWRQPPRLRQ
jgi:hypothetical protein